MVEDFKSVAKADLDALARIYLVPAKAVQVRVLPVPSATPPAAPEKPNERR
jgi:hypothetical protein